MQTDRLQLMNRVTVYHPTLYKKLQKLAIFRPSDSFVPKDALNLGSKLKVFFTISHLAESLNPVSWSISICNTIQLNMPEESDNVNQQDLPIVSYYQLYDKKLA